MTDELDKSWQRLPEARIRMREGDVDILAKALHTEGFFNIIGRTRIELLDDGIYIEISTNTSKSASSVIALPIDVFIPYKLKEESNEQSSVQADEGSL